MAKMKLIFINYSMALSNIFQISGRVLVPNDKISHLTFSKNSQDVELTGREDH